MKKDIMWYLTETCKRINAPGRKDFKFSGTPEEVRARTRLEYLREQIQNECISYGEIAELQSLAEYIEAGDVVLLEWAEVPEGEEKKGNRLGECHCGYPCIYGTDYCDRHQIP